MGKHVGYLYNYSNLSSQFDDFEIEELFTDNNDSRRSGLQQCLECLGSGDSVHFYSMSDVVDHIEDLFFFVSSLVRNGMIDVYFHKERYVFLAEQEDERSKHAMELLYYIMVAQGNINKNKQKKKV